MVLILCRVPVANFSVKGSDPGSMPAPRDRLRESTWRSYQIGIARAATGLGSTPLGLLSAIQIEEFYMTLSERLFYPHQRVPGDWVCEVVV